MDTLRAFSMGMAHRDSRPRVFDWAKAARLIRERGAQTAYAGLAGDFEYTGGFIWKDGARVSRDDTYTYLSSTWAIPVLVLDDGEEIECWVWRDESPDWDAETYWPEGV